jgi:hypothetical protein
VREFSQRFAEPLNRSSHVPVQRREHGERRESQMSYQRFRAGKSATTSVSASPQSSSVLVAANRCAVLLCLVVTALAAATPVSAADGRGRVADQDALEPLQWVVGQWRGVGQPRRGSTRGAWTEKSAWAWKLSDASASLRFQTEKGKYFQGGVLRPMKEPGKFELLATVKDRDTPLRFTGSLGAESEAGKPRLVLSSVESPEGQPARISIRAVAGGDRLGMLYERKSQADRFVRIAEVWYTREGSGFGSGSNFIECVVTGGLGTIPVTYEGKTYYVCCTGCRDYFNEDPAGVLEEYRKGKD